MATYQITDPSGKKFKITAPEGATQDEVLEFARTRSTPTSKSQEGLELTDAIDAYKDEHFPNVGNRLGAFEFGGFHGTEEKRKELENIFKLKDALIQPRGIDEKFNALKEVDPTITPAGYDKEKDIAYVNWKGKKYPINAEGVSSQDITDIGAEIGAQAPLMAAGGGLGGIIKAGSLLAKAAGVGVGAASGSAFRDVTADLEIDMNHALLSGALGGTLEVVIPTAGKMIGRYFSGKAANSIVKKFEIAANQEKARGITNHQDVITESMKKIGIFPSELQWAVKRAGKGANIYGQDAAKSYLKQAKPITTAVENFVTKHPKVGMPLQKVSEWGSSAGKHTENALGTLLTSINNISTRQAMKLNRYEHTLHTKLLEGKDISRGFQNAYRALEPSVQRKFTTMLFNGDKEGVEAIVRQAGNEKLLDSWLKVRGTLDNVHKELKATGHEVGFLENYFPRNVKDQKGLDSYRGVTRGTEAEELVKRWESHFGKKIDDQTLGRIIGGDIKVRKEIPVKASTPSKKRTIEKVDEKMVPFYDDPAEYLDAYLHRAINSVEKNKFLGINKNNSKYTAWDDAEFDSDMLSNSIGIQLGREVKNGSLTWDDVAKLKPLYQARFGKGEEFASTVQQRAKNLMYMWTLGSPMSALTQVGDLALSAQVNGLTNTIAAVAKTLGRKNDATIHKTGVDLISHEFSSNLSTARALDATLKWSGFKAVDKFGKTVHINASLAKHKQALRSSKGTERFVQEYKDAFTPAELNRVIRDLKSGKQTDLSSVVLWNDLTKAQPIALSQMPKWYLEHPKGRMLYMLKTFTIKQFDLMRREAFQKIANGQVKEGTKNLLTFATMFTGANASIEQVKNWLRGKDVDFADTVYANMHKNWGGSEWLLKKASGRGVSGAIEAAIGVVTPPLDAPAKTIDAFTSGVADSNKAIDILNETAKTLPIVGGYTQMVNTFMGNTKNDK